MVGQTLVHLNGPTKRLETITLNKKLRHGGDAFLAWQVANAKLYRSVNSNVKISKPADMSHFKVDGVAALINAVAGSDYDDDAESGFEFEFVQLT